MDVTDYTKMNREEIRTEIANSMPEMEIAEDVREAIVRQLEDLEDASTDEYWAIVEAEMTK